MAVTYRNTKKQIFESYKELVGQVRQLEKQLKTKSNKSNELEDLLEECQSQLAAPQVVVKAPEVNTLEGIIATLQAVETGISPAFGTNSALQAAEAEKLAELRSKIEEEHQQIQELFDVELSDTTMEEIIEEYLETQKDFEARFEEKQKQYKEEWQGKKANWEKEQEVHEAFVKDRNYAGETEKERDEELYSYQLKQERALEDDNYKQKCLQLERNLEELKLEKKEEWAIREKEVAEREEEFEQYKSDYEELDEKLNKATKKAEAEAKGIVERDHKVKMKLLETEANSEQSSLDLRIVDLKATIEKQAVQINKLYQQLEETQRQAQNLAIKALEGSSGSESFKAVREIAMEQAKHMGKNK